MNDAAPAVLSQQLLQRRVADLIPADRNPRTHSDAQIDQIAGSIRRFGFRSPLLIAGDQIIAGHGRLRAAAKLGYAQVPCVDCSDMSADERRAYLIADNQLALNAGWDAELLKLELDELPEFVSVMGFAAGELDALFGADSGPQLPRANLADRFMLPPFSVFNAREGWWQARKSAWIALGIRSEIGRGANTLGFSEVCNTPGGYAQLEKKRTGKANAEPAGGGGGGWAKFNQDRAARLAKTYGTEGNIAGAATGTSIFDPVLCEIAYRWFTPNDGLILDPFAGGSVRGVVAAMLGRRYVGMELRAEQIEANREQAAAILGPAGTAASVEWREGDARDIAKLCKGKRADFVFSCPPYADLERYSDDPRDLSTLDYAEFREAYRLIIAKACSLLKQDRFACFVVGEVRGPGGGYYDLIGDTVQAFRDAGCDYYNEAILVTAIGSLPIRVAKQFTTSRKLGKTHQNILVFCKGDPRAAAEACGHVEIAEDLIPPEADAHEQASDGEAAPALVMGGAEAPPHNKYGEPL